MTQTHPRVRVKVCGLTRPADARAAAEAGVDAIGLMFAHGSSRQITTRRAGEVVAALPPFVARVALFLDNPEQEISEVLAAVPIDMIQFHGNESPEFCDSFDRPYIKAVPMGEPGVRLTDWAVRYPRAAAFLLDANRSGALGGQGHAFDWQREVEAIDRPIVVAGGLTVANVGTAIDRFSPYAVDVSSGVESEPGMKNKECMQAFVDAVIKGGLT